MWSMFGGNVKRAANNAGSNVQGDVKCLHEEQSCKVLRRYLRHYLARSAEICGVLDSDSSSEGFLDILKDGFVLFHLMNQIPEQEFRIPRAILLMEKSSIRKKDSWKQAVLAFKNFDSSCKTNESKIEDKQEVIGFVWSVLEAIICPREMYSAMLQSYAVIPNDARITVVLLKWLNYLLQLSEGYNSNSASTGSESKQTAVNNLSKDFRDGEILLRVVATIAALTKQVPLNEILTVNELSALNTSDRFDRIVVLWEELTQLICSDRVDNNATLPNLHKQLSKGYQTDYEEHKVRVMTVFPTTEELVCGDTYILTLCLLQLLVSFPCSGLTLVPATVEDNAAASAAVAVEVEAVATVTENDDINNLKDNQHTNNNDINCSVVVDNSIENVYKLDSFSSDNSSIIDGDRIVSRWDSQAISEADISSLSITESEPMAMNLRAESYISAPDSDYGGEFEPGSEDVMKESAIAEDNQTEQSISELSNKLRNLIREANILVQEENLVAPPNPTLIPIATLRESIQQVLSEAKLAYREADLILVSHNICSVDDNVANNQQNEVDDILEKNIPTAELFLTLREKIALAKQTSNEADDLLNPLLPNADMNIDDSKSMSTLELARYLRRSIEAANQLSIECAALLETNTPIVGKVTHSTPLKDLVVLLRSSVQNAMEASAEADTYLLPLTALDVGDEESIEVVDADTVEEHVLNVAEPPPVAPVAAPVSRRQRRQQTVNAASPDDPMHSLAKEMLKPTSPAAATAESNSAQRTGFFAEPAADAAKARPPLPTTNISSRSSAPTTSVVAPLRQAIRQAKDASSCVASQPAVASPVKMQSVDDKSAAAVVQDLRDLISAAKSSLLLSSSAALEIPADNSFVLPSKRELSEQLNALIQDGLNAYQSSDDILTAFDILVQCEN